MPTQNAPPSSKLSLYIRISHTKRSSKQQVDLENGMENAHISHCKPPCGTRRWPDSHRKVAQNSLLGRLMLQILHHVNLNTKPTYSQELGRAELWPKAGNHRCSATRVGGREKFGMLHRLQPTTVARHYTPTLAQAWLTGCTGKHYLGFCKNAVPQSGRAGGQAGLQKVASHPRWNILGDRTTTTHNVQH